MLPAYITVQLPEFYHFRIYRGTFGKTRYGILGKNYIVYVDGVNTTWQCRAQKQ